MSASKPTATKRDKHITRIDSSRGAGWFVRFEPQKRPAIRRLFSDSKYGGKRKALTAARKFRDDCVESGAGRRIVGLKPGRVLRKWIWRRAGWSEVWYADINPGDGLHATTRSIEKLGSKRAKELVEEWLEGKQRIQLKATKARAAAASKIIVPPDVPPPLSVGGKRSSSLKNPKPAAKAAKLTGKPSKKRATSKKATNKPAKAASKQRTSKKKAARSK